MKKKFKPAHSQIKGDGSGAVVSAYEKNAVNNSNNPNSVSERQYFDVAKSLNDGDEEGLVLTESQKRLFEVQGRSIDLLLKAYNSMIELAAVRLECKLSNTRVMGVAKELKELIKVMSVYDC